MKTKPYSIHLTWSALRLGGLLLALICALSPSPAKAQCKRWDVSGQWTLQHDNGINVQVNLQQGQWQQTSANITGTGTTIASPNGGVISGNITDNSFAMKLTTDSGIFRFTGTISRGGRMEGTDNKGVHWIATSRMKCAEPTTLAPHRPRSRS